MTDRADLFEEAVRTLRHDLRNLQGAVDIMVEDFEKEGHKRGLEHTAYLEAKLAAMIRLSDRTQQLANIQADDPRRIDLGLLVSKALDAAAYQPSTKPWVELPGGSVLGDEALSVLALSEVIDNALRTGAEVRITAEIQDAQLIVRVRDFGKGMEPSAEEQALEPLIGARREGGTALGLVLAEKAMNLQQGKLALQNSPSGVTVELSWPRG